MVNAKLDTSEWTKALDGVGSSEFRESLTRRMLVEGGVFLVDKAKAKAVKSDPPYNPNSRGSHNPGTLSRSIYLVYQKEESTDTVYNYKISWNAKKAWWGRLVEFPYWRTHQVHRGINGEFYTDMSKPLAQPKLMPARPFLLPTFEMYSSVAITQMIERGKRELPIMLAEIASK